MAREDNTCASTAISMEVEYPFQERYGNAPSNCSSRIWVSKLAFSLRDKVKETIVLRKWDVSEVRKGEDRGRSTDKIRAGTYVPTLGVTSKETALGVGPYLAVDPIDEGIAVLVLLLELTDLLELLGREAF